MDEFDDWLAWDSGSQGGRQHGEWRTLNSKTLIQPYAGPSTTGGYSESRRQCLGTWKKKVLWIGATVWFEGWTMFDMTVHVMERITLTGYTTLQTDK